MKSATLRQGAQHPVPRIRVRAVTRPAPAGAAAGPVPKSLAPLQLPPDAPGSPKRVQSCPDLRALLHRPGAAVADVLERADPGRAINGRAVPTLGALQRPSAAPARPDPAAGAFPAPHPPPTPPAPDPPQAAGRATPPAAGTKPDAAHLAPQAKPGAFRRTIDVGVRWFGWKFLELTRAQVEKQTEVGHEFSLGAQTAIGLRLGTRTYLCDTHPHPDLGPEAQEYSKRMLKARRRHVWLETDGVFEVGKNSSVAGAAPVLGPWLSVGAGVKAGALFHYRRVAPYEIESGAVAELLKNFTYETPVTADGAKKMAQGEVAEFVGEGTVAGMAMVGGGPQTALGKLRIGAGVSLDLKTRASGVLKLTVTKLAGTMVRVVLSQVEEGAAEVGAALRAGIEYGEDLAPHVRWGEGLLRAALQSPRSESLNELFARLASVKAAVSVAVGAMHKEAGSYVLDMSKPDACVAYDELFRFNTARADFLSRVGGSGVTLATLAEDRNQLITHAGIEVFAQRLLLYDTLRQIRDGRLMRVDGTVISYRDKEIAHRYEAIGDADITLDWSIRHIRVGSQPDQNVAHMRFHKDDRCTTAPELERYATFLAAIGVDKATRLRPEIPEMTAFQRVFEGRDDSKMDIDVFFTAAGVAAIDKADYVAGRDAYVATAARFDATVRRDLPFLADPARRSGAIEIIASYARLVDPHWQPCLTGTLRSVTRGLVCGGQPEIDELAGDYRRLTGGRSLEDDAHRLAGLFAAARQFGERVAELNTTAGSQQQRRQNIERFFSAMASAGFAFEPVVATLVQLAGAADVIVNTSLEFPGARIKFRANEAGKLEVSFDALTTRELDRRAGFAVVPTRSVVTDRCLAVPGAVPGAVPVLPR